MRVNKGLRKIAEKYRKELIDKQTNAEVVFKEYLSALKIKYQFQKIIYVFGSFYIVDFYLPKYRIVIEIDGRHHKEDAVKAFQDQERTYDLISSGVNGVIRFENKEVYDEEYCFNKIRNLVL